MEGDAAAINSGFLTRNEARAWEDLNPLKGLDLPTLNLGYGTVDAAGVVTSAAKPSTPAAAALAPVLTDALACIRRRVDADAAKGVAYDRTLGYAMDKLAPLMEAYALAGCELDAADLIAHTVNAEVTA